MSAYVKFFGFREAPFRLTADPRFMYLAPPHRDALVALLGLAVQRRGFMVLTGDIGMGKTMVVHSALYLMQQRHAAFQSAFLTVPTLTRDELLEAILDDLQIPCASDSKVKRLNVLRARLLETHQAGGTTLLVVDEAHLLRPELIEELRLIAGIDVHAEKLLQLVLCGQSELLEILDGQQLAAMRQRVAVWQRLRPLNNTEATAYIVDRLRSAGLASPGGLFAPDAMAYVTEISNGTPRLINLICDTALTLAWEKRISQITPEVVHAAGVNLNLNLQRPLAAAAPVSSTNGNGSQRRSLQVQAAAGMENR